MANATEETLQEVRDLIQGKPTYADKNIQFNNASQSVPGGIATVNWNGLTYTPIGYVQIVTGGVWIAGDGVTTGALYWSRDGGVTALALAALQAGDKLYVGSANSSPSLDEPIRLFYLAAF